MTPQESRELFIDGIFPENELEFIRELGLYEDYVEGRISINTIYNQIKDQGQ
jgi:hypothetical protein